MTGSTLSVASKDAIAKGSKTFTFASRFFSPEKLEDAAMLYHWCRHCDDAVDSCPPGEKHTALDQLKRDTQLALNGEDERLSSPFQALAHLVNKYKIPSHYPLELIEGMAMDAEFKPPQTFADLELYCYRVAGVVGLMMAHIMGVSDERALKHACDMGMAMQLTNISRDVRTDFDMGRCYLPATELQSEGLSLETYMRPENRKALVRVVNRILKVADSYYDSGQAGTIYLDRTSAFVILLARFSYAAIGNQVRRAGVAAWETRQFTTKAKKILCLGRALWIWLLQLPHRPNGRVAAIQQVWRFQ